MRNVEKRKTSEKGDFWPLVGPQIVDPVLLAMNHIQAGQKASREYARQACSARQADFQPLLVCASFSLSIDFSSLYSPLKL
jgi:hypothetical protein